MTEENNGNGTFWVGLIVGGLAGAVFTLLNAPRSGEETRSQLRTRGMELKDTAEQKLEEFLTQSRAVLDESQKQWTKAGEEIKQIASEAIQEVRTVAMEAGKESRNVTEEAVEETKKTVETAT
jgi:gas vesicle protein